MKKKLLYILIIFGIALRLFKFGQIPVSLNRDEAALGYNAFAIVEQGIDEWGQKYPLFFKSFGDYKLPGYIYTLVLFIKLFGLNEFITRLPSLIAGIALIPLSYFLARKTKLNTTRSLFLATLIAISPWSIFYSRIAFEANLALFFFVASLIFFLSKPRAAYIFLGSIFFALSILTYNSPLIAFPAVILIILLRNTSNNIFKITGILMVSIIAISWFFMTKPLIDQKNDITIFSDPYLNHVQNQAYAHADSPLKKLAANRYVFYGQEITARFLQTFSLDFLVTRGGQNPWHSLPGKGHFYFTTYVLFITGLIRMIKIKKMHVKIALLLLLGGLIPAIITVDAPHATRSLIAFFAILLIASSQKYPKAMQIIVIVGLIIETALFSYRYFQLFPTSHAPEWYVGIKDQIIQASNNFADRPIVMINPQEQPYIYTLYYTQTNPMEYVQTKTTYGRDTSGLENIKSYKNWMFIGDIKDAPENTPIIYRQQNNQYTTISNKNEQ